MLFTYDIGHGKGTAGKRSPDGEREWYFNKTYSDAFVNRLKLYKNVTIKCVSDYSGDTDTPLTTRTNRANSYGSKCHISFHCNANTSKWGTWGGVETHVYEKCTASSETYKLAKVVQNALVSSSGLRNRGVKKSNLHMTRETKMTAILIENGFMDSTTDIKVLRNTYQMQNIGIAIADAVAKYYGLKLSASAITATTTTTTTTATKLKIDTYIGTVTNTCSIPLYSKPDGNGLQENFVRYLSAGKWLVYSIDYTNRMMNVGKNQWIRLADDFPKYMSYEKRTIYTSAQINLYSKPIPDSKYYIRKLPAGTWLLYAFDTTTEMVNLGCDQWCSYNNQWTKLNN